MKKLIFMMCAVCTLILTGCKNNPVGDEALLIGKWQVMSCESYSTTNSANHSEKQDVSESHITWEFTESTATFKLDNIETPWIYQLHRQNDNTLLIEFNGLVSGEEISMTPFTIRKLTDSEMEWEYTLTGVAGPITTQEYLKKIN